MARKAGKSQAPPTARKMLSDGEHRDAPATPSERTLVHKIGRALATAKKPNLGGSAPPTRPVRKDTPPPGRHQAIGERPVMGKTASKIRKMKGY